MINDDDQLDMRRNDCNLLKINKTLNRQFEITYFQRYDYVNTINYCMSFNHIDSEIFEFNDVIV